MTNVLIAADEMAWIDVTESNFAKAGLSVHFSDNHFICSRGPEAGLRIDAAEITFLNDPPRSARVSGGPGTNIFKNIFMGGGAPLALVMEFFIGKTDLDTFFAIQNAWLDRKK